MYEEIANALSYNPIDGELYWSNPSNKGPATLGKRAGWKHKTGYKIVEYNKKCFYIHRVVWLIYYGEWPNGQVDHINGVRDDNRIENLRLANNNKNQWNQKLGKHNTSGVKGVNWFSPAQKWRSEVTKDGVRYCSYHNNYEDAVKQVYRLREELHGEYHRHK